VDVEIMDNFVLGLTASWFATTIWGALFSLAILAFVEVRGESKVAGGTE
jgi:hypothetical protein